MIVSVTFIKIKTFNNDSEKDYLFTLYLDRAIAQAGPLTYGNRNKIRTLNLMLGYRSSPGEL